MEVTAKTMKNSTRHRHYSAKSNELERLISEVTSRRVPGELLGSLLYLAESC